MTNLINWKKVKLISTELEKKGIKSDSPIKIVIKNGTNTVISYPKLQEYEKLLWDLDQNKNIKMIAIYSGKRSSVPMVVFERREPVAQTSSSKSLKNFAGYSIAKKDTITTLLVASFKNQFAIEDKYEK